VLNLAEAAVSIGRAEPSASTKRHAAWVRACHWVLAASVLTLAFSGYLILMVHPRLYWGQVGNDLMPAFLELPISNNHRPEGWETAVTYTELENAPVSAVRTYEADLFNENGWARSLHFLAAWFLVVAGFVYAALGLVTGHARRDLLPKFRELTPRTLWQALKAHLRLQLGAGAGPPYGLLQRCAYASVAFVVLPFMVLTGLTMAPAVTAALPILLDVFGGHQSARTLHFFGFAALALFLLVHVVLVGLTGFRKQMRAMITGH
jgi:thiosulfate reductase cytochrome b subunit